MDNPVLNLLVGRLRTLVCGRLILGAEAARAGVTLDLDAGEEAPLPLFFCLHPELPLPVVGYRRSHRRSRFASLAAHLQQHLRGAAVAAIEKEPGDRVVRFRLGGDVSLELVYVAIPRRCDLVLLDAAGGVLSRARGPLGDRYAPPPAPPGELDLFCAGEGELEEALRDAANSGDAEDFLLRRLRGADARLRAEIVTRLEGGPEAALAFVRDLRELRFKAALCRSAAGDDRTLLLLPDSYRLLEGERVDLFEDPNEAARTLLRLRLRAEAVAELRSEIGEALKRERRRRRRLRSNLERDLRASEQGAKLGALGDLILANLQTIRKGDSAVEVEDIFAGDGSRVVIELDPSIDPAANADRYYRRARKAKRAVAKLGERLRELNSEEGEGGEGGDLQRSRRRLEECGDDLQALKALHKEIVSHGWLTQRQRKRLRIETPPGRRFVSSDGLEIVVGRSGPDNEVVTFEVGRDNDFWLHAAGYSGSHVLVRNPRRLERPPPATLAEAAALAAYFSKARQSSNVQVHWTQRRFLRKRKGGAPGQVLLTSYRSVTADPEVPTTVRQE